MELFFDAYLLSLGWWVSIGDGVVQLFVFEWLAFQFLARRKKKKGARRSGVPIILALLVAIFVSAFFGMSSVILSWVFGAFLGILSLIAFYQQRGQPRVVKARIFFLTIFAPLFLGWMHLPSQTQTATLVRTAARNSFDLPLQSENWILLEITKRADAMEVLENRILRLSRRQHQEDDTFFEMSGMLRLHHQLGGPNAARAPGCDWLPPAMQARAMLLCVKANPKP